MIIVTGANGFIGSALVRELNEQGETNILCVDVVDLKERPEPLAKKIYAKFMTAPIFLDWLRSSPDTANVRGVFHMGAISTTTETDWGKLVENNIRLSQILCEFCTEHAVPFIYASSGAVYGSGDKGFDDGLPPATFEPLNLYGKSKRDFDAWVLQQNKLPKNWTGLRFFNVYGPNEYHKNEMASVAYKAFLQIRAKGQLKLFKSHNPKYEDGKQLRDFVYVKDITRWMIEIFNNAKFTSGIYNMGYGTARTWLDLAQSVFTAMNCPLNIDWVDVPANIRNQYQYFTQAKMDRAFAAGLTAPKYNLESGVSEYMKRYLLSNEPYL